MNLPNWLTLIRIIFVPIFLICFYVEIPYANYVAGVIFVIAFITDIFDGMIARKKDIVSNFGKLFDPIADKLLVTAALVMLVDRGMLNAVIAIVIIAREFLISGLRAFAAAEGKVIAAAPLGKAKTVIQCVAIVLLLFDNPVFSLINVPMDQIMVWAALVMTIVSGADYVVRNRKYLVS